MFPRVPLLSLLRLLRSNNCATLYSTLRTDELFFAILFAGQALPTVVSQAADAIIEHQGAAEQTEVPCGCMPQSSTSSIVRGM